MRRSIYLWSRGPGSSWPKRRIVGDVYSGVAGFASNISVQNDGPKMTGLRAACHLHNNIGAAEMHAFFAPFEFTIQIFGRNRARIVSAE